MIEKELEDLTKKMNRLMLISRIKYSARADKDLGQLNLTESSVKLLQYIDLLEKCGITKASQMLMATQSFTSKIVNDLEMAKLINKTPSKEDKREVFIELTAKGKETVQKILAYETSRRKAILELVADKLGKDKLEVLSDIVDFLLSTFEKEI